MRCTRGSGFGIFELDQILPGGLCRRKRDCHDKQQECCLKLFFQFL